MGNSQIKRRILVVTAILALLLSGIASFSNSVNSTDARMFCRSMGWAMGQNDVKSPSKSASNPDSPNREWTVEELFGNSVSFSKYYGEGPGGFFIAEKIGRAEGIEGYSQVKTTLENSKQCLNFTFIPNSILGTSNLISGITSSFVNSLIGFDRIAETLVTIIGGDGNDDDGLIGTFLNSFYMPLVVIAAIIMTVVIIYKGLIKFQFREALSSLIWSLGAFIIGVTLMLNPQMMANIPQTATSTITTCVLGALSGQNCFTGEIQTPSILAGKECLSSTEDGSDIESALNSMNCTVWKAFVLDPWAEVQFGQKYSHLYTKNQPAGGRIWANLPEGEGDKYCVNFSSTKSYTKSTESGMPVMDNNTDSEICNVALYQLFLKTKMKDTVAQEGNNYDDKVKRDSTGTYDERWYDIIIPMAKDNARWDNWADGKGKLGTSMMSLVAIIAASSVLLVLAAFGGAYKIIGLILMAFAPVFLLFAIEPTRGRRIFLGWLETLVSSILKYFAITVLIIIALIMYSGLLANTSGVESFIAVLILTVALHMYRKEIVDLIGASNMGGERLSNQAAKVGNWAARQTKEKGAAAVGGAVGGAAGRFMGRRSEMKSRKESIDDLEKKMNAAEEEGDETSRQFYEDELAKEKELYEDVRGRGWGLGAAASLISGGARGSVDSTGRAMKRGQSAIANVFQQTGRTRADLKKQAAEASKENKARRAEFEKEKAFRDFIDESTETHETTDEEKKQQEFEEKYKVEVERERANMEDFDYEGELSPEEIEQLDELAKKIAGEYNDEELMELIRSEEVLQDPNKKRLVAREINARLGAYNNLEVDGGILNTATAFDRAETKEEFQITLEAIKEEYINNPSRETLNEYTEGLVQMGATDEEIKELRVPLLQKTTMNLENDEYREIVEKVIALEDKEVTLKTLRQDMGVDDYNIANDIMDVMEADGIISASGKDGEPHKVIIDNIKELEVNRNDDNDTDDNDTDDNNTDEEYDEEYDEEDDEDDEEVLDPFT